MIFGSRVPFSPRRKSNTSAERYRGVCLCVPCGLETFGVKPYGLRADLNGIKLHANPNAALDEMSELMYLLCSVYLGFVSSMEDVDSSVLDLLAFHAKTYTDIKSEYEELKTQARDPIRRVKSYLRKLILSYRPIMILHHQLNQPSSQSSQIF